MATFIPFDLERWQGEWETRVAHNLAESGVQPLSVAELLAVTKTDPGALEEVSLGYSETIGSEALRTTIAELYPGASAENVLVTVGSAEANFITAWTLATEGRRVAVQTPVYKQVWGVAGNLGAEVAEFGLDPARGWALDADQAEAAVTPGTECVVVTNPNNPTGHVFSPEEKDTILTLAERAGAWLLVDEIYRGAELNGPETPTWFGATERTVVTGGLSKAYGLPGLRLGWLVGPEPLIREATARHDYVTIGPSAISDFLAIRALTVRDDILARTRRIMRNNYDVLDAWRSESAPVLSWTPPQAGAIVFAHYGLATDSTDLVEYFRREHDTLLVPGAHFDRPGYLRIGFGEAPARLAAGLAATAEGFRTLVSD